MPDVLASRPPEDEKRSEWACPGCRFCAVIFLGRWAWMYNVTHRFSRIPTGNRRRESELVLCDWMHYRNHLERTCPVRPLPPIIFLTHPSWVTGHPSWHLCWKHLDVSPVHAHYINAVCNTASTQTPVCGAAIAPDEAADFSLNLCQSQQSWHNELVGQSG